MERVPGARFLHADLTEVQFDPSSFDAVVAFYVFGHVPREELGPLLARIAVWLRPGGYLLATFGVSDTAAWRGEALGGVETFFSSYQPDVTVALVGTAGLDVLRADLEVIGEPEGDATVLWILAGKTAAATDKAGAAPNGL